MGHDGTAGIRSVNEHWNVMAQWQLHQNRIVFASRFVAQMVTANEMVNITTRRVIRALEAYYVTGIPISQLRNEKIEINFAPVLIGLQWERKELYNRINSRVDNMIKTGLIQEIEELKEKGYNYSDYNSLNTVGVKEVFDYLGGKINYDRMLELFKQNTRRFAKRQLTWFRKEKNIKWIEVNGGLQNLNSLEIS